MDRENLRELRTFADDDELAAKARLLREFDPASAGAPDLDVPDPYYGGPDGFETVLDQVEAACRGLLDEIRVEPRPRRARRDRSRARSVERVGGGDINDALQGAVRRRVVRVRQDARGRRARRVRGRGGGPALARRARRRCASPRCSGVATRCSCSSGSTRAAAATAPRSARAWPRCTPRARPPSAGRADLRLGSLTLPPTTRARLADVLRPAAAAPAPAARRLCAGGNRAVERVCERMPELAGPPEPPARLHGDLWSGNVLWGRDGRAVADRSRGLRRPPRGRPGDAAAVRLARRRASSPPTRSVARSPPATRNASSSTSSSRCSCTPRCSAAATAPRPSASRGATPRECRRRCS